MDKKNAEALKDVLDTTMAETGLDREKLMKMGEFFGKFVKRRRRDEKSVEELRVKLSEIAGEVSEEDTAKVITVIYGKAFSLAELGEHEEAIAYLDILIQWTDIYKILPVLRPVFITVLCDKGISLLKLGKYKKAIDSFDKVIEVDEKDKLDQAEEISTLLEAWKNKGLSLSQLGKHKEAIKCYNKAIETVEEARNNQVLLYSSEYEDDMLIEALNNKGISLDILKKYEDAADCFAEALDIDPENEMIRENRRACLARLFKKSRKRFNKYMLLPVK